MWMREWDGVDGWGLVFDSGGEDENDNDNDKETVLDVVATFPDTVDDPTPESYWTNNLLVLSSPKIFFNSTG